MKTYLARTFDATGQTLGAQHHAFATDADAASFGRSAAAGNPRIEMWRDDKLIIRVHRDGLKPETGLAATADRATLALGRADGTPVPRAPGETKPDATAPGTRPSSSAANIEGAKDAPESPFAAPHVSSVWGPLPPRFIP